MNFRLLSIGGYCKPHGQSHRHCGPVWVQLLRLSRDRKTEEKNMHVKQADLIQLGTLQLGTFSLMFHAFKNIELDLEPANNDFGNRSTPPIWKWFFFFFFFSKWTGSLFHSSRLLNADIMCDVVGIWYVGMGWNDEKHTDWQRFNIGCLNNRRISSYLTFKNSRESCYRLLDTGIKVTLPEISFPRGANFSVADVWLQFIRPFNSQFNVNKIYGFFSLP